MNRIIPLGLPDSALTIRSSTNSNPPISMFVMAVVLSLHLYAHPSGIFMHSKKGVCDEKQNNLRHLVFCVSFLYQNCAIGNPSESQHNGREITSTSSSFLRSCIDYLIEAYIFIPVVSLQCTMRRSEQKSCPGPPLQSTIASLGQSLRSSGRLHFLRVQMALGQVLWCHPLVLMVIEQSNSLYKYFSNAMHPFHMT